MLDEGQLAYMAVRLTLEAAAVFSAIVLWSRTRDAAWMLVISGVAAAYAGTVYSVLKSFGITGGVSPAPFLPLLLSSLPPLFFLAAFVVEAARRRKENHGQTALRTAPWSITEKTEL